VRAPFLRGCEALVVDFPELFDASDAGAGSGGRRARGAVDYGPSPALSAG
jgi:hypothetical protein